ncbi:MAG: 4-alpha-glucanotransferase, partial [Shewanella sp.]
MGLDKLLYLRGVGAEFTDCFGQYVRIPESDRLGILRCMLQDETEAIEKQNVEQQGIDNALIEQQNYALDAKPWTQVLAAFHGCFIDEPWLSLYLPQGVVVDVKVAIYTEQGEVICLRAPFAALKPIGDYRIRLTPSNEQQYLHYRLDIRAEYRIDAQEWVGQVARAASRDNAVLGLGYHRVRLSLVQSPRGNDAALNHTDTNCPEVNCAEMNNRGANGASLAGQYGPQEFDGTLMVAPRTAYQGCFSLNCQRLKEAQGPRPWGLSIQLYSLRSDTQWGIGDFADLSDVITLAATYGADFIQLNPLHALDIAAPQHPSPYSPSDRRRLNPLYIHLPHVAEYALLDREFSQHSWQEAIAAVNQGHWLDYPKISDLKYRAFARLY